VDEASVASGNHHTAAVEASLRKQFGDAQSNLMSVRVCSVLEESCVNMGEEARAELLELADVKGSLTLISNSSNVILLAAVTTMMIYMK
jgi:hypothetical protein